MCWFNFILGLFFIFLCFILIIIHYHIQKQRKIKMEPWIKLNHKKYTNVFCSSLKSFGLMFLCLFMHHFTITVKILCADWLIVSKSTGNESDSKSNAYMYVLSQWKIKPFPVILFPCYIVQSCIKQINS